jgi:glycosyltransferase involved in cell wall biosynthesis
LPEITEPSYGVSIAPMEPVALADAIQKISGRHKEMGQNAREKAETVFSEEIFYQQLLGQLERLE